MLPLPRSPIRTARQFGYLEIQGGTDEVQAAPTALGATARDATGPEILASKVITMLDPREAFLVNRNKIGSMALAGSRCSCWRCSRPRTPILAASEAGRAARFELVDYRMIGVNERLYLSGSEVGLRHAVGPPETCSGT